MYTQFKLVFYAKNKEEAEIASSRAFKRIDELDKMMSDYLDSSELSNLSRQAGGSPVKVSKTLYEILSKAQDIAVLTNGAFDITIGPVVQLWRRARRIAKLPDKQQLLETLSLVGYQNVHLDKRKRTVLLNKKGMRLDLGGIAKGYAADVAINVLKKHGIQKALVAAGGDIVVSGAPPGKKGWTIGIAALSPTNSPRYIQLSNAAISTSGDTEQFVDIDGTRYSHIVDPRTGLGIRGRSSVTVVTSTGTMSDSLATALSVLGPDAGISLADTVKNVAALFLILEDNGIRTIESKRWKLIRLVEKE
jgi:FAD:protein FMN transferase